MKIYIGLTEIRCDGMGSAAINLVTALQRKGIAFQTVHIKREVDVPEFLACNPRFLRDTNETFKFEDILGEMIRAVNQDPACTHFMHFGGRLWGAIIPYLRPDIKVVVSVHGVSSSSIKNALAHQERVSVFVPVSWGVEELLKKALPKAEHHKIIRVVNAIDVGLYLQKQYSVINQPPKILYMGRVEDVTKGCDKIPWIAKQLKAQGMRFQWDLYGYFHFGYEPRFVKALARCQVQDVVAHKGCLLPSELRTMIPQYDVLVMPSNHEGFGLTLVEAMASGVACVASRLSGVTDKIIDDGKNGVLVSRNDIAGFARAIESLLCDADLRQSMGAAARERAASCFDLRAHGENYLRVFEQAANDPAVNIQETFDVQTYRIPEALKSHILARILPPAIKRFLKKIV